LSKVDDAWIALRSQLGRERTVTGIGILGIALGAVCALAGLVRGFEVPPEGNIWDTATFNGALGFFLITQALLAPEAGFSAKSQRRWAVLLVASTLFAYGLETVQAFRGLDPRFTQVGGTADQILGGVFFLDALFIMVLFLVLMFGFFKSAANPLRVAVRYAAAACLVSFGIGIWMSVIQGRVVGSEGNLLLIHAAGFHGLQAIPIVALLLRWGGTPDHEAVRRVHLAGLTWFGLCLAILWQAGSGLSPMRFTLPLALTLALFLGWTVLAGAAARHWMLGPAAEEREGS